MLPLTLDGMQQAVELARERLKDNPEFVEKLERLGRERALIYKTLVLTGLRKNELASLTVGQLDLDGLMPFVVLDAADEKNRQGSTIPLRADHGNQNRLCSSPRQQQLNVVRGFCSRFILKYSMASQTRLRVNRSLCIPSYGMSLSIYPSGLTACGDSLGNTPRNFSRDLSLS